jgi:hypothetical protein
MTRGLATAVPRSSTAKLLSISCLTTVHYKWYCNKQIVDSAIFITKVHSGGPLRWKADSGRTKTHSGGKPTPVVLKPIPAESPLRWPALAESPLQWPAPAESPLQSHQAHSSRTKSTPVARGKPTPVALKPAPAAKPTPIAISQAPSHYADTGCNKPITVAQSRHWSQ